MLKMAEMQSKCGTVFRYNSNPKIPLKIHFTMVRAFAKLAFKWNIGRKRLKCPKWHKIAVELNSD